MRPADAGTDRGTVRGAGQRRRAVRSRLRAPRRRRHPAAAAAGWAGPSWQPPPRLPGRRPRRDVSAPPPAPPRPAPRPRPARRCGSAAVRRGR